MTDLNMLLSCFREKMSAQGTEVKAITYSAMQINEEDGFAEVFVIIDI